MTPGFKQRIPNPTQANLVLDFLRIYKFITQKDAWEVFGISDLAGRIRDLKKPRYGCIFEHEDKQGKNRFGKRVSFRRYILVSENPEIETPDSPPPTPTLSLGATPKPKAVSAGQHYGE